ncbi:hypothetical protein [Chenggangzhangella methanolivorans]|uniref:Uncharacterized protein n=1 Tax=Chenggangzhangella methanolivorans TaxID=1437009 RepID=A0A9E6UP25_9HYPH|nr:hypothetical protein [Chenggangzhangella methanolivorans]QZN99269.1 hypothetical protein K6K41_21100 [Chenggangzhangella methanolivorans]
MAEIDMTPSANAGAAGWEAGCWAGVDPASSTAGAWPASPAAIAASPA